MSDIYNFQVKDINGKEISIGEFKGKVLLIVNVASKCGFTSQYKGLQELYNKYSDRGFVILGFPCNQFGHQEPGDEQEIKNFSSASSLEAIARNNLKMAGEDEVLVIINTAEEANKTGKGAKKSGRFKFANRKKD